MEKQQSKVHKMDHTNNSRITQGRRQQDKKSEQEAFHRFAAAKRANQMHNTRHWSLIFFIWFSLFILIGLIVFRLWHVMMPAGARWLPAPDLARIDEIFVDGSIGALLVGFFQEFIIGKSLNQPKT